MRRPEKCSARRRVGPPSSSAERWSSQTVPVISTLRREVRLKLCMSKSVSGFGEQK